MKKTLQIANAIALLVTFVINYLSNTGLFNGNTMASVSAKYQNYFTPAGYAFSIWGLIYLGLLAFAIYQGRGLVEKKQDDWPVLQIGWWFVISCVANCLWVIVWLYDYIALSVLIMFLLLFSLIKIILRTRMELDDLPLKKIAFVWWPFSLYSGWITVALMADIAAWLTKIEWNGFGISQIAWTIIMICVAGLVNLFMTWNRNMREYALVGVWALIAIAVSNWNGVQSIVFASLIVASVLFLSSAVHAYKNRKANPLKRLSNEY